MAGVENPDIGADGTGASASDAEDADKLAASIVKSTRTASGEQVKGA
jgi:hypothetical protein